MTTPTADQRHLAALIDGEPGPGGFDAAIDAVARDAELRTRFERGLLIGQVLRGEPSLRAARAINTRVSAALASEPVVMRPSRRRAPGPPSSINRSAAGLAIAASLGAVAILVGPGLMMEGSNLSAPDIPMANRPALPQPDAAAPGANAVPIVQPVVERWAMDEPAGATALDRLVIDHRERTSASGLTGFMPYVAVVGPSGVR
ncbi:sigma-E factor negative regulatory protein [Halochromatium sp.]